MPKLILGPLLRYVDATSANVWVETDEPCAVEVLQRRAWTFHVEGHHYALVRVQGLEPDSRYEYRVALDGTTVWPMQDSPLPPSVICTLGPGSPTRLIFGSCRVTIPHTRPYTLRRDDDRRGRGVDALRVLAESLMNDAHVERPDALVLLGDQVYADDVSPNTRDFIGKRRDISKPPGGNEVADFEEYTALYREAWSEPVIRWLLSTLPSTMIFDDHDVHDDWNTSEAWVQERRSHPWWQDRIVGAFVSYWLYQHLGNLAPDELENDELYRLVQQCSDAGSALREFAAEADDDPERYRWSFYRDFGKTRLVVIDSRAGRVLERGRREMLDEPEWRWLGAHARGGFDHLLLGTSLPLIIGHAHHYAETWNEAVCAGAWGEALVPVGERIRQIMDFEHWSAFGPSFDRLAELIRSIGAGERGAAPATIMVLSGDVHHSYIAGVDFGDEASVRSRVYQAVCSPFRNALDRWERIAVRLAWSRSATAVNRVLAQLAGASDPRVTWRLLHPEPWVNNHVAWLDLEGREAEFTIAQPVDGSTPALEEIFRCRLAPTEHPSRSAQMSRPVAPRIRKSHS